MTTSATGEEGYHRVLVVISEHPQKPLLGNIVALQSSNEEEIDSSILHSVVDDAKERFEIEEYATELYLGILYVNDETAEAVGVCWEDSPKPYNHDDFEEPVDDLPDDLVQV
ncbi:hypothetical protein SAMN04487967_0401 [Natronorubrum sediminis]|uniref:Uncharacterized protein n=1 Tax=Natronorubrum sediminis TaxID=640943 RepID=A0A1H6FP55_9EURY|nr:hypothetical protein [Natronorubrum sediminis]SEH11545.1 hypothetical protein SAMN04487967_0401 [Natronorubrum sediminis]